MQRHLRDAIELNRRRQSLYAEWTDGASVKVSRRLIAAERVALPLAWFIDREAEPYQAAGVPIVCAEFVSMARTPPLPPSPLASPGPARLSPGPDSLRASIRTAYAEAGFRGVASELDRHIRELETEPDYHCMTRHLLESMWRVAVLAPEHARRARTAGLRSPRRLSRLMLRVHLAALGFAAELDRLAAPHQSRGIPILCHDVPPLR